MSKEYEDLWDVLPADFTTEYYCESSGMFRKWEEGVEKHLKQVGWCNFSWRTGEYDSFGPLSRILTCVDHNGQVRKFIYG